MQTTPSNDSTVYRSAPVRQLPRIWLVIAFASLAAGFALTFDPSFDDLGSTVVTLVPFVLLPTMVVAFTQLPTAGPSPALTVAAVASVAAWSILVFDDDRWSILTFALLGLCFSIGGASGVGLAAVVAGVWTLAWALVDGPEWRLLIPVASFGVGVILWMTLVRAEVEGAELIALFGPPALVGAAARSGVGLSDRMCRSGAGRVRHISWQYGCPGTPSRIGRSVDHFIGSVGVVNRTQVVVLDTGSDVFAGGLSRRSPSGRFSTPDIVSGRASRSRSSRSSGSVRRSPRGCVTTPWLVRPGQFDFCVRHALRNQRQ